MPNNTTNVTTGKPKAAGAVFEAPINTPLPIDATEALNAAFTGLGFVSDEGMKNNQETQTQEFKDWGGQTVLTVVTSNSDKFNFSLIEALNVDVLKQVFGAENVFEDAGLITIAVRGGDRPSRAWVFDIALVNNAIKRIVIPNGKVVSVGEVTYAAGEIIKYPIELATAPDASGNTHYEYILSAASA
jgi:hypothetical protein